MMVAPLVFGSIVQGFAGAGDAKKAQRIGWKAFVYFEVVTAFALLVGLVAVNVVRPGEGVVLEGAQVNGNVPAARPQTLAQIILHMFPTSLMDAMARNDVLQVVCFAVIFAVALIASGEEGRPVLTFCSSLTQVMFKFAGVVMPLGLGRRLPSQWPSRDWDHL
jgi:proton glutamate symport protein